MSVPEPGIRPPPAAAPGAAAGALGRLPWAVAGAWGAVAVLWLLDALGRGLPAAVDLAALAAAGACTAGWAAVAFGRLRRRDRRGALALAVLLVLAVALCFVGLDHELGGRPFGDEGTYLNKARSVNEGGLLRPWFIYPHLLFYLDALALWAAGLMAPLSAAVARGLYGVTEPALVEALVARSVTAALGAAAVPAAFFLGRRIAAVPMRGDDGGPRAGPTPSPAAAGLLAGLLTAVSPLWIGTAQLNLSDVAAATLATLALTVAAGLLDGESPRRYLAAGALAGLAAGGKYPAGLVAIAIFALWLRGRLRHGRRGAGNLLLAAGAAIAAFLLATPSLLAFPEAAFSGDGADVLFGFRLYAERGFTGVVRASNARYYGEHLLYDFGLPAIALGIAGVLLLAPAVRRRLAWLLPFPAGYLGLLLALQVAVPRNLLPVLPALAAVLGVGLAGLGARIGGGAPQLQRRRRAAVAAIALAAVALPAWRTGEQAVRRVRPTTRELARAWIERHLPPGSYLVAEDYTPPLGPPFVVRRPRFAIRLDDAELRRPEHDFLFLSGGSYNRFLRRANLDDPVLEHGARRYRELFAELPPVERFPEEALRDGTELRLYRLDPESPPWAAAVDLDAGEAVLSDPSMAAGEGPAEEGSAGSLTFSAGGQWALFKAYLEPGRYRARIEGAAGAGEEVATGGLLRVLDRSSEVHAEVPIAAGVAGPFELSRREKVFLYVLLPAGSELTRLVLEPA